ncbi:3-dehydroquinate dehydratase, partial [Xanthomonas perforans]
MLPEEVAMSIMIMRGPEAAMPPVRVSTPRK